MAALPPISISILDDHRLFRQGIMYILQSLYFDTKVQEAATFGELLDQFAQQVPDILLLDLQMPDINGIEATKRLLEAHPSLKIIVLSMHSTDDFISHMFKLGVRSYLPKDVDKQLLSTAIGAVMTDGYYFTDSISKAMARGLHASSPKQPSFQSAAIALTPREIEVLALICKGYSTNKIAEQLFISDRTVEGHRKSLLEKTNTPNAVTLALYALKHGLLAPDSTNTPSLQ
ncbi:response regulator transcription factor [Hymenobacter negativus]|uniref:Response regulator transcription factor n=1 Tax=Hymenobacter negativus TaxID=2795026 RepID=A0ABS3QBZ2_9BACT|nr:response regulator transcription factor [Hymenobacter negativus]MBO2008349.1 response regulator transcription factor [Hymenobacter negativus]